MKSRFVVATAALSLLVLAPVGGPASASGRVPTSLSHHQSRTSQHVSGKHAGGANTHTNQKPDKGPQFKLAPGYTFTNPLDKTAGAIRDKILAAINHTHRGQKIRLVSWNFDNRRYVGALTAAHKRGASVRIIMARTLAKAQGANGPYNELRRNLDASGNANRPADMRSWFHTCSHSCRGRGGSMHAKYYIFSRTGSSRQVVMNTSANLTGASANTQWNEMYTVVNQKKTYDTYMKVFMQASQDRPRPALTYNDGDITGWFYPRPGRGDFVKRLLDGVVCKGAVRSGINGKTEVRVAQDVFNNKRGLAIARRLAALYHHGCSVKVVYSQAVGADIRKVIDSMPHNHLVQDRNGDGVYDRYLHAKLLTISGHYLNDHSTYITTDGSANYSATALQSDEQGMIFHGRKAQTRAYARFIDRMFRIHLVSAPPVYTVPSTAGRVAVRHVGRFHGMEG